jgi:hypothetical protein
MQVLAFPGANGFATRSGRLLGPRIAGPCCAGLAGQTHRERLAQILSSWPVPNARTAFVQSRLENASLLADSVTKGNMFPREGVVRMHLNTHRRALLREC